MTKHHSSRRPQSAARATAKLSLAASVSLALSSFVVGTARADGEQIMPGGTQAIGRGGATAARPTDNMAMSLNPAGLVELSGNQVFLQLDTVFDHVCVQPYGFYGWGVYLTEDQQGNLTNRDDRRSEFGDPASAAYGRRHLDRMCNSGAISALPQFAFSFHVTDRLSLAAGFVAPAMTSIAQWGGEDGTIQTDTGPRPSPTRYQFVRQEVKFALNPTVSAAYRVLPWLSVGATLQVAMVSADNYLVMPLRAGTSPANDMMAKLHASDFFMPSLTLSVHAKPHKRVRIAGTFNWSDGLNGSGDMTLTTNTYHSGAAGNELLPFQNDPVKLSNVRITQPWSATLAARYAHPRGGNETEALHQNDVLVNELWDVEADASFTANQSSTSGARVNVAKDFTLEFRRADGSPQMPLKVAQSQIDDINVERHTRDVMTVRLGGSFNVLPGKLQVSAGCFYQTRGVDPSYASIDSFGFQRVGLSLGLLFRAGRFDLMAAFAHVFSEDMIVAPPDHEARTAATDDPASGFDQRIYENGTLSSVPRADPTAASASKADGTAKLTQGTVFESDNLRRRVVNAGHYTASFNVLSLGVVYHF